jgi:hypothetical protein
MSRESALLHAPLVLVVRGRIQVGVGEARSRKKKSSESVHVAGPRGPADPADPTMGLHFVHKCCNVTHFCFNLLLPDSRLAENHRSCRAGVGYRCYYRSISTSYLGLNQKNNCRRILNTWRNTAASVGLELDSSALWTRWCGTAN